MKWPFYIYLYDVVVPLAVRFYCVNLWINRIAIIDPRTNAEPKCCDVAPDSRHPACWPIDIPIDDPFYSLFGRRCLEFVRSATGLKDQCKLGTRFHISDSFAAPTEWINSFTQDLEALLIRWPATWTPVSFTEHPRRRPAVCGPTAAVCSRPTQFWGNWALRISCRRNWINLTSDAKGSVAISFVSRPVMPASINKHCWLFFKPFSFANTTASP